MGRLPRPPRPGDRRLTARWITRLEEAAEAGAAATVAWTLRARSPQARAAALDVAPLAGDLAHAARRRDPARRAATLERRLLLRALAARALRIAPAGVGVEQACDGPPRIVASHPLHAAAAARDGWIVLAVSPHPVGVDVERIEPGAHRPLDLLHPRTAAWLAEVDDEGFTTGWAAAEAGLKAFGLGLQAMDRVIVDAHVVRWAHDALPPSQVETRRAGDHVFALACRGPGGGAASVRGRRLAA